MAGEELNDAEFLKAKMQEPGVSRFEYDFCKYHLDGRQVEFMSIPQFREKYPLKPQRLEEQK